MSKEILKPLPCPICGAELKRWQSQTGIGAPKWNHPNGLGLDCPLAQMPAALGDPFFVFDEPDDINAWNAHTPQRKPLTDEAEAVINAARAAMDASTEAQDGEGGIKIASDLAASLSLCLDEYDSAIEAPSA